MRLDVTIGQILAKYQTDASLAEISDWIGVDPEALIGLGHSLRKAGVPLPKKHGRPEAPWANKAARVMALLRDGKLEEAAAMAREGDDK